MKREKVTIFGIDFIKETDDEGNVFMYNENTVDNPKLKEEGVGNQPINDPELNT